MHRIINVSFAEDPIQTALENISDPCQLIFPTKISAATARQRFMSNWELQDCEFLSMDELAGSLILPPGPCASDDKRMLCLYQALTEEDRQHFHIGGYFDVVEWGNHFFQLFAEVADECVPITHLEDPFGTCEINLLSWQEDYLARVLAVRSRYRDMLGSLGLSDPIFFRQPSQIEVPRSGCRYIFVNQYYFSKLEKEMLAALEKAENEVLIITQGLAGQFDRDSLRNRPLDLKALQRGDLRTHKISVIESANQDQMVLSFLACHAPVRQELKGSGVIVDTRFYQSHYRHWFDPRQFAVGQARSMVQSGIYAFLQTLQKHLAALRTTATQTFLPLRMLLDACSQEGFLRYYQALWGEQERKALLDEFRSLFNQDILYVDTDLGLFEQLQDKGAYPLLRQILVPHFQLLDTLGAVASPAGLVALIDAPEGLAVQNMCSREELDYSDVLEQFYERLSNFASLERIPVVSSWQGLFGCEGAALGGNTLQLWLESLASAQLRFKARPEESAARFAISNLLDLRDLQYDKLVVFHAIEGEYPSAPAPVWLFNENQRERLGLKSYPLLRERDRYYFFRQVFNSGELLIYTYRNQEKDIEPGSFVTELQHFMSACQLPGVEFQTIEANPPMTALFLSRKDINTGLSLACDASDCGLDWSNPDGFFVLPPAPELDFGPKHQLTASYQSLSNLDKNPFAWYVSQHRKIRKIDLHPEETISRKLFGALLHGFLSRVLRSLPQRPLTVRDLTAVMDSPEQLRSHLDALISDSLYLYKLPQNYNHEFLTGVISECLVSSIRQFYRGFLLPKLGTRQFRLIPEEERVDLTDEDYRILLRESLDGNEYLLRIRGIADLRVESPEENIIVDFKTGSHHEDQLHFYEWYYYLLDEEYDSTPLSSSFWMILEHKTEDKTDPAKRDKWRERMRSCLIRCLDSGYPQGTNAQNRRELRNITRADLYRPPTGGEA